MAVPLAGMFLPALAKVGAVKLPLLLRAAGITAGAAPGLLRGDLGAAVTGGALGGVGTLGMGGLAKGGVVAANKAIAAEALKRGLGGTTAATLQGLASAGIPLAAGGALGTIGAGTLAGVGRGAGNVGKAALGLAGYGTVGGEAMSGRPIPPGMGPYGNISPIGNPIDVLDPLGQDAGRRLRTVKDAEALRDAQNIVLPTVRKFAEQAKRDEFSRDMAAKGIRTNIELGAELAKAAQQASLDLGTTASRQAGEALTGRFKY